MSKEGTFVGAILVSATMLVLALPLGEQAWLAWFAFVPVLAVTRGKGFIPGLFCGISVVLIAAIISKSGVFYHYKSSSGTPAWVYSGFGIFGFSVSIAIGAWGDVATRNLRAWWFAGLAALLEAFLLVQLPGNMALSQYRQPWVLTIASFGGVWLVSFLVWWSNFWLAELSLKLRLAAMAGIAVLANVLQFIPSHEEAPDRTFALVQIADPDEKTLGDMEARVAPANPDFAVWPEFGGLVFNSLGDDRTMLKFSEGKTPFITSFRDGFEPLPHNVSTLITDGKESDRYFKRRLFGSESKMHSPGRQAVAATYLGGKVGLNICFDSCYPEVIRDTARIPGVNVISLPSIDPEATNYFIAGMHAAYTPFRAAENGVAFLKCDGVAYSQIVDPYGKIVAELPPGNRTFTGRVSIKRHQTVYSQFGDWFLVVLGIAVPVRLGVQVMKDRKVRSEVVDDTQTGAIRDSGDTGS